MEMSDQQIVSASVPAAGRALKQPKTLVEREARQCYSRSPSGCGLGLSQNIGLNQQKSLDQYANP